MVLINAKTAYPLSRQPLSSRRNNVLSERTSWSCHWLCPRVMPGAGEPCGRREKRLTSALPPSEAEWCSHHIWRLTSQHGKPGKLLKCFVPQFSHQQNRDDDSVYLTRLLWGLHELIRNKMLVKCRWFNIYVLLPVTYNVKAVTYNVEDGWIEVFFGGRARA